MVRGDCVQGAPPLPAPGWGCAVAQMQGGHDTLRATGQPPPSIPPGTCSPSSTLSRTLGASGGPALPWEVPREPAVGEGLACVGRGLHKPDVSPSTSAACPATPTPQAALRVLPPPQAPQPRLL